MDFSQFLQDPSQEIRLPYFEGNSVCDDKRAYRLRRPLAPGWYVFREQGRYLRVVQALGPDEGLAALEGWELREWGGYAVEGQFIGQTIQRPLFGLTEGLERFTPIVTRQWFDGHLLFAGQGFESEADLAVREAYEEERTIEAIKGVTPALASAFVLESMRRFLEREAMRRAQEEAQEKERQEAEQRRLQTFEGRVEHALAMTGAELVDWRQGARGEAVIKYRVGGRKLECVVDQASLRIVDAGICLVDHDTGERGDNQLTLASLPSAVGEAMAAQRLVVWRGEGAYDDYYDEED